MFVKLRGNPLFTGELYKTQFIDGVSQEHINRDTFDKLAQQLGLEPEILPDVECPQCLILFKDLEELKFKLRDGTLHLPKVKGKT